MDHSRTHAPERLEQLFLAHEPAVVAYVRRRAPGDVVDDVVAETFLVAWRRLEDIPEEALPWLLGVARRVLSTHRRAAGRRDRVGVRLIASHPSARIEAVDPAEDRVAAALARLSEKDREALILVAWDGLTPQQAAAALGEPAGRFRVRLHRARQRMKALLDASPPPQELSPLRSHR
jgi:RNA polymerase sigma-70 factor (ECF subfamily)